MEKTLTYEQICKIVGRLYLELFGQIENQGRVIMELRAKLKEQNKNEDSSGEPTEP